MKNSIPKKSSWSAPEGQLSSLDLFICKCRQDINQLRLSHPSKSNNLTKDKLLGLRSLRCWEDIVIKLADKGVAVVVWWADLYKQEGLRQPGDATFYSRVGSDPILSHQKIVKATINNFIQAGDLLASATNLIPHTLFIMSQGH